MLSRAWTRRPLQWWDEPLIPSWRGLKIENSVKNRPRVYRLQKRIDRRVNLSQLMIELQAGKDLFIRPASGLSLRYNENQAVTKDLTSSSKFSGSCVLTLQTLPQISFWIHSSWWVLWVCGSCLLFSHASSQSFVHSSRRKKRWFSCVTLRLKDSLDSLLHPSCRLIQEDNRLLINFLSLEHIS